MNLVESVQMLVGRELTVTEATSLAKFQKAHEVDDSDPLIIVYAMMAKNQLISDSLPGLLQEKVNETIELHRTVLREQAIVVSKEVITELARNIETANVNMKARWMRYSVAFLIGALMGGAFAAGIVIRSFSH